MYTEGNTIAGQRPAGEDTRTMKEWQIRLLFGLPILGVAIWLLVVSL